MNWILFSLFSAFLLGVYDLCKKHAVEGNAVLPVLFFSNVASMLVWLVLMAVGNGLPPILQVQSLDLSDHLRLAAKSCIVGMSWIFAYFGLKHLPVSIVGPIRASSPLWILGGALVLFGERPSGLQMLGIGITLMAFFALSLAGQKEGIHFHRNRWIGFIIAATLLGASSALYDKYLLNEGGYSPATVQAWFCVYLVVFFAPFALGWKLRWWTRSEFHWRWSIPSVGLLLLLSDFLYFYALHRPESLVAVVSCIRRSSVLVSFAGGILLLKERYGRAKLPATLGVLLGVIVIVLG